MIEFELKIKVDEFPKIDDKFFVKEKRVLDVYFDTEKYDLIAGGNFLRVRNGDKVNFKLNIGDLSHSYCKETSFLNRDFVKNEDVKQIFKAMAVDYQHNYKSFEEFLKINDLRQLAVIDKLRKTYKIEDIEVSFDDAKDIGKFIEIEKNFPDNFQIDKEKTRKEILEQFKKFALVDKFEFVDIGYVELYLKEHNLEAYNKGLFKE